MVVKIEVTTKEIERAIAGYKKRGRSLDNPLKGFGNYYLSEIKKQFRTSTDPEGNRWANLLASTLEQKRRQGYSSSPLVKTGSLENSFSYVIDRRSITIKSSSPILRFHEDGTKKMVARPVIGKRVPQRHKQKLLRLLRTWVKRPR